MVYNYSVVVSSDKGICKCSLMYLSTTICEASITGVQYDE